MSNSSIAYTGTVTLTIKNKKYKKHNQGSKQLFHLLCRVLSREWNTEADLPAYVMIYNLEQEKVNESTTDFSRIAQDKLLRRYVDLHSYVHIDENNFPETVFTGIITSDNKLGSNEGVKDVLTVALIDSKKENILATFTINGKDYKDITSQASGILQWTLSFTNTLSESSEEKASSEINAEQLTDAILNLLEE